MCTVFEGACKQAKDSRRKPTPNDQQPFTVEDLEWFAKNAYNLSLQYCSEFSPENLVRLLNVCIEVSYVEGLFILNLKLCSSLSFSKRKKRPKPQVDYLYGVCFANFSLLART
jgi:hypothetical protein